MHARPCLDLVDGGDVLPSGRHIHAWPKTLHTTALPFPPTLGLLHTTPPSSSHHAAVPHRAAVSPSPPHAAVPHCSTVTHRSAVPHRAAIPPSPRAAVPPLPHHAVVPHRTVVPPSPHHAAVPHRTAIPPSPHHATVPHRAAVPPSDEPRVCRPPSPRKDVRRHRRRPFPSSGAAPPTDNLLVGVSLLIYLPFLSPFDLFVRGGGGRILLRDRVFALLVMLCCSLLKRNYL
ncbi:hypothetical protein GUJ93_ZPchr0006g44296 [Zizania palustris]|uniref:Uncharacterized protein n=1 Tax=Zizania palustris TaxID=103762 RepID=A0A8J5SRW6_ZIZPA|nr:hypothetical protein GUJ93_ZPchr0006g44296 [Zizania palustris]